MNPVFLQTESDSSHPLNQGDHGENSDEAVRKRYGDKEVPFVLTLSSHHKQIIFFISIFVGFHEQHVNILKTRLFCL